MPIAASGSVAASHPANGRAGEQRVESQHDFMPLALAFVSVAGAIGVGIMVHRLSARQEAVARFAAAAMEFRSAFTDVLAVLESGAVLPTSVDKFLLHAYDTKQFSAFATFAHFVPNTNRIRFTHAWEQYHSGQTVNGKTYKRDEYAMSRRDALFLEYGSTWREIRTEPAREIAAKRIRALLVFASHK